MREAAYPLQVRSVISPYVSWFRGLNVDGDALVPGINVSFPL